MGIIGDTGEDLEIVIRKTDDSILRDVVWNDITWSEVDEIGILSDKHVIGFDKQYGCPIWYARDPFDLTRPLFYVFQRFWGKIGTNWHQFYITKGGTSRTPYHEISTDAPCDERKMGWTGTISYSGYDFPVDVGIRAEPLHLPQSLKTKVTTPLDLTNHGIEYQFYLNPFYASDAQKNVRYIKIFTSSGEQFKDVTAFFEVTSIPDMDNYVLEFWNQAQDTCLGHFDFEDLFDNSTNRFLKIEEVTLPNGETTYCIHVGATFGALSAGNSLDMDPEFGVTTTGFGAVSFENRIYGIKGTITEDGTLDYIMFHGRRISVNHLAKAAVYEWVSDNEAGDLLATSEEITVSNSSSQWVQINFTGAQRISLTNGTNYWLVVWGNSVGGDITITLGGSGTVRKCTDIVTYNGWPEPYEAGFASDSGFSVKAGYTAGAPTTIAFNTMRGTNLKWDFGEATIDSTVCRRSTDSQGKKWIFEAVSNTGTHYIPSGTNIKWAWCVENAGL